MGQIVEILKNIKRSIFRFKLLPRQFWFNKNIGYNTTIDNRIISLIGAKYLRIGNGTKIMANLRIEAISNYCGIQFNPEITIGDSVCINQNFHCTCASRIEIGDGTSITANCGIFDIEHPYDDININPRLQEISVKPIKIGKDCLIGMNSVILPGVCLGDHVIVGSNSTVRKGTYPSYCVIVGMPATIVKRFDFISKTWRRTDKKGEFIE